MLIFSANCMNIADYFHTHSFNLFNIFKERHVPEQNFVKIISCACSQSVHSFFALVSRVLTSCFLIISLFSHMLNETNLFFSLLPKLHSDLTLSLMIYPKMSSRDWYSMRQTCLNCDSIRILKQCLHHSYLGKDKKCKTVSFIFLVNVLCSHISMWWRQN